MAKYTCDTENVYKEGEALAKAVSQMNDDITNYVNNLDSDLSLWDSTAKKVFVRTANELLGVAKKNSTYANSLSEYITSAAKSIQSLEEELANIDI